MSSTTQLNVDSTLDLQNSARAVKFKNLKFVDKIQFVKNFITVEPLLCCYIFPSLIASLAVQNLMLEMACRVNLQFNDTICSDLLSINNTEYEKEVEIQVTSMIPWKAPIYTSIPAIMVLFLGSYSDRHNKRKPFLMMPLFGEVFSTICFIFCAINISNWPMEIAGISESVFPALSGGLTTMMMAVYSYVADISSVESRTLRIGVVHILAAAVTPIGLSLSGILFEKTGYFGIFSLSLIFYAISFFLIIFYIKEPKRSVNLPKKNLCLDLFNPKHVLNTFTIVFKKRKNTERLRIVLLMISFILILGPQHGEANIVYFFTRTKYQWDPVSYSLFYVFDVVVHLLGSTIAISVLSQWLKFHDILLAAIACSSKIAGSFFYALSETTTMFYFAPVVCFISSSGIIAMRSCATKLVNEDEIGKIQSLFGICEAIAPLIYSSMYSQVYIVTINDLPGAFFLLGSILLIPAIIILLSMYILEKRDQKKIEINKNEDLFKYTVPFNEI